MALVYVGIGFFYKEKIKELLKSDSRKYDAIAGVITLGLLMFCWFIYKNWNRLYYFDMKPVYYKELVSAVLIPCGFGVAIVRIVHWMEKSKCFDILNRFLCLCGQATIPIMFMHVPLNNWKDYIGYGRLSYMVIGIGTPLVFTLIFNNSPVMRRVLGIPKLNRESKI